MSSDDIVRRRRSLAEETFGGHDHHRNDFTSRIGNALVSHGAVRSNRLDEFRFDNGHGIYDTFDVITSAPMLGFGIRATGDHIDSEAWAFSNEEERTAYVHQLTLDADGTAQDLRAALRSRSFVPKPPRLIDIPKIKFSSAIDLTALLNASPKDVLDPKCIGKTRPLTIAGQLQRAAGKAAINVLNAYCHLRWPSSVIGCRPGIGIGNIMKALQAAITSTGRTFVLAFDIKGFFDNVPIKPVLDLARHRLGYHPDSDLGWLLESAVLGRGCYEQAGCLPQGNPLSPFLANLYAAEVLDEVATRWGPFMRYVDDGFLLCQDESRARRACAAIARHAERFNLRLADEKTQFVDLRSCSHALTYLGLDLHVDAGLRLHYSLRNASIVKLWYNLGITALGSASTLTAAETHLLALLRRHQIWTGWSYAFGAAEWSQVQVEAVRGILDVYKLGGDRLRVSFAEAWRESYAGDAATRGRTAERFSRAMELNGIEGKLDADGSGSFPSPGRPSTRPWPRSPVLTAARLMLSWRTSAGRKNTLTTTTTAMTKPIARRSTGR